MDIVGYMDIYAQNKICLDIFACIYMDMYGYMNLYGYGYGYSSTNQMYYNLDGFSA